MLEETGLRVSEPYYHGTLTFMMDGGKTLHTRAHVFSTHSAKGRARSSVEGPVRWYSLSKLPRGQMWEDDDLWLPLVLAGIRFNATFTYDAANRHVTGFSMSSWPVA